MRSLALAIALIASLAGVAHAHQSSVKIVDVVVEGDRATVAFTISPGDVTVPLGLADNAQPTVTEAMTPAAAAYVAGWLAIATAEGPRCLPSNAHAHPDGKFVIVEWEVTCATTPGGTLPASPVGGARAPGIDRLTLDFTSFFALDKRHEAVVGVHVPGDRSDPTVVRASDPILTVHVGEGASIGAWIRYGMDHIYSGRDHVCFVLALLLVVVLVRRTDWETRSLFGALRATAAIITSFTVAHSISLIAASLGWIELPSRLVESLIAISIIYTAIENVVRPDVRWRFALTFGFGLVHGLGFASVLQEQLPPTNVIVPLLSFNVGVEIGQLTVVAVALPVFWLASRQLGADRYRRWVLPSAAAALTLVGIKWLIERAFDVSTFTFWGM